MTMRCSRCDVAHDETSRCPTDLEYERGYRSGVDVANKKIAKLEMELSQSACANVSLRQQLARSISERDAARRLLGEDRIKLIAWVLRNNWHGCFTGDCPHQLNSECIQAIIDEYEAAREAGEV